MKDARFDRYLVMKQKQNERIDHDEEMSAENDMSGCVGFDSYEFHRIYENSSLIKCVNPFVLEF